MRRRNLWFAMSGVIIVIGAASLGWQGLNLGIDFKGGVQMTLTTPKPVSLTAVRKETAAIGISNAVVQGRNRQFGAESYESFQIRLKKLQTSAQRLFLLCLAIVGLSMMGAWVVSPPSCLTTAATLGVMVLTATWDFSAGRTTPLEGATR